MSISPGDRNAQPNAGKAGGRSRPSASGRMAAELVPASRFTYAELVAAYNQTRVDYIVPMPMNETRLREYVRDYDVDLDKSVVAIDGDQVLGLAMLGIRPGQVWVTRLGVLPVRRRGGVGQALMEHLIDEARRLEASYVTLDVIKDNDPAYYLFLKLGFYDVRELLVVRRPPGSPSTCVDSYILQMLGHEQALELLGQRQDRPSWLTATPSLENSGDLKALRVELANGDRGWMVYQETSFQLRRLVLQTTEGDPHRVGLALLHAVHATHPTLDTKSENLPAEDSHWLAAQELGYLESFRRIEMRLDLE